MDNLTKKQRSYCMSQIKSKHTVPEKNLRKAIKTLGINYRIDSKILGKPDIKIVGYKIIIFLDGCFWHSCPKHFIKPKNNNIYWEEKIKNNVNRDKRQRLELRKKGYLVIKIWEHETKNLDFLEKKLHRIFSRILCKENQIL